MPAQFSKFVIVIHKRAKNIFIVKIVQIIDNPVVFSLTLYIET